MFPQSLPLCPPEIVDAFHSLVTSIFEIYEFTPVTFYDVTSEY